MGHYCSLSLVIKVNTAFALMLHRNYYDPILDSGFWILDNCSKLLSALRVMEPASSIQHPASGFFSG